MAKFLFWQQWLFVGSLIIIGFGLFMALLNQTGLFDLFNRQVEAVFWGKAPVSQQAQQFQHWIYGVLGATMVGWGIFIAFVAHFPFKAREKWAWQCLLAGIAGWYLLDTGISLSYRFYFNALFNTLFLILMALPLGFTYPDFFRRPDHPSKGSGPSLRRGNGE